MMIIIASIDLNELTNSSDLKNKQLSITSIWLSELIIASVEFDLKVKIFATNETKLSELRFCWNLKNVLRDLIIKSNLSILRFISREKISQNIWKRCLTTQKCEFFKSSKNWKMRNNEKIKRCQIFVNIWIAYIKS